MLKKAIRNPYIIFLPFLFYYIHIVLRDKWPTLYGDEIRYVDFATNLIHGFYSPYPGHINLWNGPGYPLVLVPFIFLKIPALYTTLMNALYQYLMVVFLYKSVRLVANSKIALVCGLLMAVYPNGLSMLPILYTEAFTGFLVSSLVYSLTLFYKKKNIKYSVLAGLILGFLTLTKVIFGYVLLIGLIGSASLLLFRKNRQYALRSVYILLIAFAVTSPYLAYTYYITGKVFYWGNSGGMSLYWMSTPYAHEYGDWKLPDLTNNQYPALKIREVVGPLRKNHLKEVSFILKHDEIEQDALFKQAAINNIKKDPFKFLNNYYDNFARMLFNFPYSYAYQDAAILGNIIRGSLILWASIAGIILTVLNWRKIIYPVRFLVMIAGLYLGLSGALSAYPRQLDVILPMLFFWIGFLIAKMPKPGLRFAEEDNIDNINLEELTGVEMSVDKIA